jgi:thioredoxin 2
VTADDVKRVQVRCGFCLTLNSVRMDRAADRPRCGKCERPMLLDRPLKVEADDFQRTVLESGAPVLVDFYADWCGPCHMLAPHLDTVAGAHVGELLVVKVDSDRAQEVSRAHSVSGLPTVVLFRNGVEVDRVVGMDPAGVQRLAAAASGAGA